MQPITDLVNPLIRGFEDLPKKYPGMEPVLYDFARITAARLPDAILTKGIDLGAGNEVRVHGLTEEYLPTAVGIAMLSAVYSIISGVARIEGRRVTLPERKGNPAKQEEYALHYNRKGSPSWWQQYMLARAPTVFARAAKGTGIKGEIIRHVTIRYHSLLEQITSGQKKLHELSTLST